MSWPSLVSAILGVWLLLFSPSVLAQPVATSSLLQPCPDSPNCELTQRSYDTDPDTLFSAAVTALEDLGPTTLDVTDDALRAHAVYRVALIFKDDVHIAVTSENETGSTLHIRSASRVGYNDLGVNARRVERFFESLSSALPV